MAGKRIRVALVEVPVVDIELDWLPMVDEYSLNAGQSSAHHPGPRTIKSKTARETAYLVVSLPAQPAQPTGLGTWGRSEWHIKNCVHRVRDVTLREELTKPGSTTVPPCSPLRNTAIGHHRSTGETNMARATRRANRRPNDLIDAATRTNPTTQ